MKICTTCGKEYADDQKFCPDDGTALRGGAGAADLVGSVIAGSYHIRKKLGEGGMGAVYLGEHVKMGRKSAIKVMAQSMANDPDAIARFNREATNAARINHPHVCQIYDFGETPDGLIYLAMEFIEGEALTDLLEREGRLQPRRAATLIRQAADALQTAHDMEIVHRDLKPDNIMIARARGGGEAVKVVDFGIAKAMGGDEGQKVTKTGLVVGTPEYMSPEQLSGDTLDGRSDIYSLALVLYRMLTGTLPFEADSAQEVMIKRLTDDPVPLKDAAPDVPFPAELQQVLDKALARMPAERYDRAARFADDVQLAVSRMPEDAPAAARASDGATQLLDPSAISSAPTAQLASTRVQGQTPRPKPAARTKTPDTAQPQPSPVAGAGAGGRRKAPLGMIAAAVAGLVVVGGGTVVILKGGGSAVPPDSGLVTNGGVTNDTARTDPARNSGGSTGPGRRTGGDTARPQPPDTSGGGGGGVVAVDSAQVDGRLNVLTEPLLEDQSLSAGAVTELRGVFENGAMPPTLRGRAARFLMQHYISRGQNAEACLWGNRALDYPMSELQRSSLDGLRGSLGCTP